jgi:hypothetical protein
MKRICSRCGEEKDISEFSPSYKTKDGTQKYDSTCKECYRKIDKKRRKEDPIYRERKIASSRKSYQNNREKRLEEKKEYHIKNREVILEKKRIYRQDPKQKEYRRIWMKNYFNNNKDKYQLYRDKTKYIAIWRQLLRDIFIDANKRKQKYIIEQLGYNTIELHNHLESLFKEGMTWDNYGEWEIDHKKPLSAFDKDALPSEGRQLLRDIFIDANKRKQKYIIEQLGYNTIELHNHLESLFKEGMTWDNYGEWEIDHKKPLSAFDKDALPSEVNALSNLQPLWKIENQQKYNHWDGEFENEMNNISDEMIDEMIDGLSDEELNDFDNELDNKNNINKN